MAVITIRLQVQFIMSIGIIMIIQAMAFLCLLSVGSVSVAAAFHQCPKLNAVVAKTASRTVLTATAATTTTTPRSNNNNNNYEINNKGTPVKVLDVRKRELSFRPDIRRVLCVSDIHTDHEDNFQWTIELQPDPKALLIVAGDISHKTSVLRKTLKLLRSKFGAVAFTPGNHELWVETSSSAPKRKASGECQDSLQKLEHILNMCEEIGVYTGPVRVGGGSSGSSSSSSNKENNKQRNQSQCGLWVVPLLSWHHQSFDTEPDIDPSCWKGIPTVERLVSDYRRTAWPSPLSCLDDSVAQFIDSINDNILPPLPLPPLGGGGDNDNRDRKEQQCGCGWGADSSKEKDNNVVVEDGRYLNCPVLTFSHFVPRIELTPEKRYLRFPTLNKAVGSQFLEHRIRQWNSTLHVFGHTHFGWDMQLNGTRYMQVALGYPKERRLRPRSLGIGTMERTFNFAPVCVWKERTSDNSDGGNVNDRRSYNQFGFPAEVLGGYWSNRYHYIPRTPNLTNVLAPWVAPRYIPGPGGAVESFAR